MKNISKSKISDFNYKSVIILGILRNTKKITSNFTFKLILHVLWNFLLSFFLLFLAFYFYFIYLFITMRCIYFIYSNDETLMAIIILKAKAFDI